MPTPAAMTITGEIDTFMLFVLVKRNTANWDTVCGSGNEAASGLALLRFYGGYYLVS
jgi:hypothetical protein